jgi:PTS system galactitol-specific IIA component
MGAPRTGIRVTPAGVTLDAGVGDAAAAIRLVAAPLVADGSVTPAYVEAVVARESTYPTALPTLPEPVAIPHADPDGVAVPSIAFGRLAAPVEFTEMASEDRRLAVRLILLLALQSKDQAPVLSGLIRGLQQPGLIELLATGRSADEIARRIGELIDHA